MNKNETRNCLKAKLQLMVSFAQATASLKAQIIDSFADSADDQIYDILDKIQSCEHTDIDDTMSELESYLEAAGMEDGEPLDVMYLESGGMHSIEVGVQYSNGERLAAFIAESETGTFQSGSLFFTTDKTPIDLTMAEIKKGDLAEVHNLPEDNKDIDIYVWSDVGTEDYLQKYRIQHADIIRVLNEGDAEGGKINE